MTPPSRVRRHKISLACEPCRSRKSRCNGAKPICSTCERRKLPLDRCVYKVENNARMASNDEYITALHDRIRHLESLVQAQVPGPTPESDHPAALNLISGTSLGDTPTPQPTPRASDASCPVSSPPRTRTPTGHHHNHHQVAARTPYNPDHESVDSGITAMGTFASEDSLDDQAARTDEFHGTSSAASFIKEACDSVMGPPEGPSRSPPTRRGVDLPAPRHLSTPRFHCLSSASMALPPRSLADHLLERYFDRVFYLYPILHRPSFERAYQSLWEPASAGGDGERTPSAVGLGAFPDGGADSIAFHCALSAIFALGCHFSDLTGRDRTTMALTFFHRSKSLLGLELLESDTLSVVQALLIMTLFLQSTPFAGMCWNGVGIACRLAQGIGLHIEAGVGGRSAVETQIRRRVWHGCVVIDMLVSMTFGRPAMTTHKQNVLLPSVAVEDVDGAADPASLEHPPRMAFFIESVRLSTVLEKVLDRVYQPWRNKSGSDMGRPYCTNLDTVTELDSELAEFEASLPPFLSWTEKQTEETSARGSLIALQRNILRGRFFYVRLMLYRPLLSSLWSSHRKRSNVPAANSSTSESPLSIDALRSSLTGQCASYCVRCAMHLLELTYNTFETECGAAWWWDGLYSSTAGVVLIMGLSCPLLQMSLDARSLEASWGVCQEILSKLSSTSSTVRKSLELLNKFYALACAGTNTDEDFTELVNGVENSAFLADIMAHFYPEEIMGDTGAFGLDPNLIENAW